MSNYDFSGWATRNNVRCSDGRTILQDAFKRNDGQVVPLVWNHQHNEPTNVLGHALLENRPEGVYAYGTFNDTEAGQHAKELVQHGDIRQMSIYANQLKQQKTYDGANVLHGMIREVSLVYASANPEAYIESIIRHSDDGGDPVISEEEGVIYTGENISLSHAEEQKEETKEEAPMAEKTVKDVFDELTEEQKTVVYAMIGQALEEAGAKDEEVEHSEGGEFMKHNVFDQEEITTGGALSHSDIENIFKNAKRCGSLKESFEDFMAHSTDVEYSPGTQTYGVDGADWLFPEAHNLNKTPEFIKRDTGWVAKVMGAVHHTPFSRIKSVFADIREEEARAKGYIKGKLKKEEVFTLLKRTTTPTTIYKKQKLDRDDVIDITDFDVVAWIKTEMRMMLDEEIARAILIGDGRLGDSDDKINEANIRPVLSDHELFSIKAKVNVAAAATDDDKAKAFIRAMIKERKNYKGSGNPTLYTTADMLSNCLLLEDNNGRIIYDSIDKLKNTLRVKDIVEVPVMEGLKNAENKEVLGIMVNLADYNVGADKGGAINLFDDFDIDYNQQKYLIETRCSGALIKPFSAIVFSLEVAA